MKTMMMICFLILGSKSFAKDDLIITASGYGFQCFGFCSGHQEDSELVAKRSAGRSANRKCQDEGYAIALLIEYKCRSHVTGFGNIETTTNCDGVFLCDDL